MWKKKSAVCMVSQMPFSRPIWTSLFGIGVSEIVDFTIYSISQIYWLAWGEISVKNIFARVLSWCQKSNRSTKIKER